MADGDWHILQADHARLQERLLGLMADLGTLRDTLLILWHQGSTPTVPERDSLALAQAQHAARVAKLARLLQVLREEVCRP